MGEVKAYRWSILTQIEEENFKQELEEFCKKHNAIPFGVEPVAVDMDKVKEMLGRN